MSKLSDLINEAKDRETNKTLAELGKNIPAPKQTITKPNPFANLKKTVAALSSSATAEEGANPPRKSAPSSTPFKFNLGTKKVETQVAPALPMIPATVQPEEGVADSLQETVTPSFSEAVSAKEFQSPDQPDEYNDEHVRELKQALSILEQSIDNKELVADALKNIMVNIKQHVFLKDILLPEDCQLMVRGLRESYGVTIAKKQKKRGKRDTNAKDVEAVMEQLADLDITI